MKYNRITLNLIENDYQALLRLLNLSQYQLTQEHYSLQELEELSESQLIRSKELVYLISRVDNLKKELISKKYH